MKRSDCLGAQALLTAALLRTLAGAARFIDNPTLFSKPEDRR